MILRENTGRYLVENEEGNEYEVLEYTSTLKSRLTLKIIPRDGTSSSVCSYLTPRDYELNGTRLIMDKKLCFYEPITSSRFRIKAYDSIIN